MVLVVKDFDVVVPDPRSLNAMGIVEYFVVPGIVSLQIADSLSLSKARLPLVAKPINRVVHTATMCSDQRDQNGPCKYRLELEHGSRKLGCAPKNWYGALLTGKCHCLEVASKFPHPCDRIELAL